MITARFWRIAVLRGKCKLLSADDMREFINQENQEELKEALTIRFRSRKFLQRKQEAIRDYVYLKSPTVPDAIKNFMANERKAEDWFRASKRNP